MNITEFIDKNYLHFNSGALKDAARAYKSAVESGTKMMVTLAGAMSTAELGISLAEMIRQDKVHIISCTGANLEEDLFHLIAANHYERIPHYRELSTEDDYSLWQRHLNRVTDTCIPEEEAMRRLEDALVTVWTRADQHGMRFFPHEMLYQIINEGMLKQYYQKDPSTSWLLAACEKNIPIIVPGWEDSSTANMFAGRVLRGLIKDPYTVRGGTEYMVQLLKWYTAESAKYPIGFFQIGGGIAGDFPVCTVPTINQDMRDDLPPVPMWAYFCQISDSTTSYGSYSGAPPNEKITWGKLRPDTPRFIVESDATIVAPLMFGYILGW